MAKWNKMPSFKVKSFKIKKNHSLLQHQKLHGKMAQCYFRMNDFENAIKMAEMSFSLGHEIADDSPAYSEIMRSAIEVTVKISEKICKELCEASLKDEISSLHSTVNKMLQVLKNSFYEDRFNEEKSQLLTINGQLIEALQKDKDRQSET